jgi:hypothetical protein
VNQITLTGAVASEPRCRSGLDRPAVAVRLEIARRDTDAEPLYVDIVCPAPLSRLAVDLEVGDQLAVFGGLDHHEWVAEDGLRRARW